ncbi:MULTISPECIES: MATE family efflux transporter [Bacillus cereus group]|uniref:MATE efflux family protein n=1 Tax=Bacillus thuringiensis TaxID=1428 RepID=A0AB33B5W1_BACTU|nr:MULTISPECIES: MATE family efflux transporter [Bacillus cereus group]QXW42460.1 MATE family efflux transporter [Klebsiella grimontii]HDR7533735.1 MATE family efflux transporter [Bacillus anthracis]AJG79461.1 MATE efflux family protein [Bacillus thuringiensis]EEM74002.1 MATE efflux [Bacillus thuringiensis serovar pondicheriensis BGSC 4BA1]KAA0747315.1 MATE family efflux transporter [Bacillus sp. AY1-10]
MAKSNSKSKKETSNLEEEILRGPIIPISIKLAMPILIGQFLLLIYGVTDTIFISMLDKSSTALMSGIGLVFPVYMLFLALGTGMFTGVSSLLARGIGEQNKHVINKAADSGLVLSSIAAFVTVVILYIIGEPMLNFLAGNQLSQEAVNYASQYFYFIIPGLGLIMVYQALLGVLQGEGLSQYYGISMLISTVFNIILNPIFIFVFDLGVAGSALATTVSITISLLFVLSIFKSGKSSMHISFNFSNIDKEQILEIIRIGIPQVLSMVSLSFAMMFLNNLIGSISETSMNSWVLVGRMDEFILMVGYAFSGATLTLIGQNYGRKNYSRVLEIFKKNVILGIVLSSIFVLIYVFGSKNLFSLFTTLPEVVEGAVLQVKTVSITYVCIVTAIVVTASFQATGKAMPGLIIDIIRMGVVTIPLAYLVVYQFNKGVVDLFYVIAGANIFTMFLSVIWCYSYLKKQERKMPTVSQELKH